MQAHSMRGAVVCIRRGLRSQSYHICMCECVTWCAHMFYGVLQSVMGLDLPPDSPRLFGSLLPPEEMKAETLE